ncbi:F-box domain-containing protein [Mycena venus]|uniref:F-box domain-containing protein n=1 Tax=Mycena venus TaxID=2733690 RepID=A0A8H7CY27_9AGAR|nr:F-box domain-containing protein [Mycena venus]
MSTNAAIRAEVASLTSSISHYKKLLDDMQTRLGVLQSQLDSVVYPVSTLPPEMMSEIFTHCLPTERWMDMVNTSEAPLLLMHVCRTWRQITISTPNLWTTFDVNVAGIYNYFPEIAQSWLARAREYPLSVKISGVLWDISDTGGYSGRLFRDLPTAFSENPFFRAEHRCENPSGDGRVFPGIPSTSEAVHPPYQNGPRP